MSEKNRVNKPLGRGPGGPGGPGGFKGAVEKPKNSKDTLKRLWVYLSKLKLKILLAVVVTLLTAGLNVAGPVLMGIAIDDFIGSGNLNGLTKVCLIMAVIYLMASFTTWLQLALMVDVAQGAIFNLRKDTFNKLQSLSLSFFDKRTTGDLMSRVTNDIDNINNALSQGVTQFISGVVTIVSVVIIMIKLNWILGLVVIITFPITMLLVINIGKKTRKYYAAQQKELGKLNGMIEENISGQKIIIAYSKENDSSKDFHDQNEKLKVEAVKANIASGIMGPTNNFLNNIRYILVVSTGAILTYAGMATVGLIATFITYARQLGQPISQMANLYGTIMAALAGAERVFEIMDEEDEILNSNDAIEIDKLEGNVEFKNVDFSYVEGTPILKDISFNTPKGQMFALVGPTGAGKTTIINLLTRFYDINNGSIKIDGIDISKFDKDKLRSRLGIVLQDTYMFTGTIMDNIRYGKLDASDEDVVEAAKISNAHQFIKHLPEGYDTLITEGGQNFSQGQRQLMSIARTILANPDILILDEATSSVDTVTEQHIQKGLLNLISGRTSFVIAHRLSTIKNADTILVIKDGNIIEEGDHNKLLSQEGFYANLFESQYAGL